MTQDVIVDNQKNLLNVQYLASIAANGDGYNLILQDDSDKSLPPLIIACTNSSCSDETIQIDFNQRLNKNDRLGLTFVIEKGDWTFAKVPFTTVEGSQPATDLVSTKGTQMATITVDNVKKGSFWEYFINLEGPQGSVSFDPGLGGRRGS